MIYWRHQYVKRSRKRGAKRQGKIKKRREGNQRNKKTWGCCINWGRLYWHERGHPPHKHTQHGGSSVTVKHVLLLCSLWVENYSRPDRLNDKLSKRQHVRRRAKNTQTKKKRSAGNRTYEQAKMQILRCDWMTSSSPQSNVLEDSLSSCRWRLTKQQSSVVKNQRGRHELFDANVQVRV